MSKDKYNKTKTYIIPLKKRNINQFAQRLLSVIDYVGEANPDQTLRLRNIGEVITEKSRLVVALQNPSLMTLTRTDQQRQTRGEYPLVIAELRSEPREGGRYNKSLKVYTQTQEEVDLKKLHRIGRIYSLGILRVISNLFYSRA